VEVEAQNAESFWAYFKGTFIPEVEAIYKDVEQIVDGAPAVTTTTTTTTTVA
jgi:ornithine cyclodeaminase/alanine dehydrogenase-like protein (mu-crystallin family)